MLAIIQYIKDKNFESFDKLKETLESDLSISVKDSGSVYMLSFTETSDLDNPMIRECSGLIVEKFTNKILHYSFQKCYDSFDTFGSIEKSYNEGDTFNVANLDGDEILNHYFDGSMVKIYYHNDKWNISTSRHIDGSKNFWSSKMSFGVLFEEAVINTYSLLEYNEFLDTLDTEWCYTYILQHPLNNTTLEISEAFVFFINRVNTSMDGCLREEVPEIENFKVSNKTVKSVIDNYNNLSISENYIVYKFDNDGNIVNRIKIMSPELKKIRELKGNYPNIGLQYLEHISNDEKINELGCMFPSKMDIFDSVEEKFCKTVKQIFNLYVDNNIMKKNLIVPKRFEKTLHQLHSQYKKKKETITVEDVIKKLEILNPRLLASIIEFKY